MLRNQRHNLIDFHFRQIYISVSLFCDRDDGICLLQLCNGRLHVQNAQFECHWNLIDMYSFVQLYNSIKILTPCFMIEITLTNSSTASRDSLDFSVRSATVVFFVEYILFQLSTWSFCFSNSRFFDSSFKSCINKRHNLYKLFICSWMNLYTQILSRASLRTLYVCDKPMIVLAFRLPPVSIYWLTSSFISSRRRSSSLRAISCYHVVALE